MRESQRDRRLRSFAARVGLDSGRSAPCVQPNTPDGHHRENVRSARDVLPRSVQFSVATNVRFSVAIDSAYRERLNGQWGVVDVEDCINAARYLVAQRKTVRRRLIIRGGSAGGYTTLAALAFRPDVFTAGASYYGISDIEALAHDTHKFESRYLNTLVGPYPQMKDLYRVRSPIHFVRRLSCPLILFQGLEDKVVPPSQSEEMANALRAKGIPVVYLTFEGEQYGFRKAETIIRCLEQELAFYLSVLG